MTDRIYVIPASEIAEKIGSIFTNSVMLGALVATGLLEGFIDIKIIESNVKSLRMGDKNLEAFKLGFNYCSRNCFGCK